MDWNFDSYESKLQLGYLLSNFIENNTEDPNPQIEIITLDVTAGSTTFSKEYITKSIHKKLLGISLGISDPDSLEGSTFTLAINEKIFFDAGTQARLLTFSSSVPPDRRFERYVMQEIDQSQIKFTYTSSNAFTTANKVKLYLLVQ
ncbi:MAG: hypothetical protein NTY96_00275 [Bacteroidetes bacterium]|nr:hypothetical protein [Bacteroidota bacterium]